MGLFDFLKLKKTVAPSSSAMLFTYLRSLVNREDLIQEIWQKYKSGNLVRAYLEFERFITSNKPLVVKKEFTKDALRQEIIKFVKTDTLVPELKVFFLPPPANLSTFFWVCVKPLTDFISENLGQVEISETIKKVTGNEKLTLDPRKSEKENIDILYLLFTSLFNTIQKSFGDKTAKDLIEKSYKNINDSYGSSWIAIFFEFLPEGLLSDLKVSYLSKEDLVKKVAEATKVEREKLTTTQELYRKLKERSTETEEQKAAILNLLEDAKTLEEELKKEKAGVEAKVVERTKEVSEEKVKLLAAINSFPRAFILTDTKGIVILHNESLIKMFSIKDPANITLDTIAGNLVGFDFLGNFKRAQESKGTLDIQDISIEAKFYDVFITPVVSNDVIIGMLVTIKDDTEERVLARSKDEFFSIASHELRTPLTAIRGNTALIKDLYSDQIKDKEFAEMISDIHDSSVRLINIVNDFLNVSRLEMGKIEFKNAPLDLVATSGEVVKEIESSLVEKKVSLDVEKPATALPNVMADKDRVKEVLINLIGNALKFTEEGGVKISFTVENNFVKTSVTDTGRGISPENQALLFHKFQQAGSSLLTRDTTKGTGLGLYISKLIVEGMGGKIWIEKSEADKGSVFSFTLPLA
ncbi:MAG TPA: ATP-binding protein [Patescibacteria group bacterium]|nr:ATP-binding protein [Patescibacteria group bacterium]